MQIKVEQTDDGLDEAALVGRMRSAAKTALNDVAREAVRALERETLEVFDRPRPVTQRAFASFKARERGDTIDALVFVKSIQAQWLEHGIFGGTVTPGDFGTSAELGLAVPGPDAKRDVYGGLPRGSVAKAIADGGFFKEQADGDVSVLKRSLDGGLDLIATFVREAEYSPIFDFFGVVEATALEALPEAFTQAMARETG